jgi:hypothetical protein
MMRAVSENQRPVLLKFFYLNGIKHTRFSLVLTYAGAHFLATGYLPKTFCQKLIYITCLAHRPHRDTEGVLSEISLLKTYFPSKHGIFRENSVDIVLPPKPC